MKALQRDPVDGIFEWKIIPKMKAIIEIGWISPMNFFHLKSDDDDNGISFT